MGREMDQHSHDLQPERWLPGMVRGLSMSSYAPLDFALLNRSTHLLPVEILPGSSQRRVHDRRPEEPIHEIDQWFISSRKKNTPANLSLSRSALW